MSESSGSATNFTNADLDKEGSTFHSNPQDRAVLRMMTNLRSVLAMGGPMMNTGKSSMCSVLFKSAIKSVLKNKRQTKMPQNLVEVLEEGLADHEGVTDAHDAAWGLRTTLDAVYDAYVEMYCGITDVGFHPVHKQISNVITLVTAIKGPNSSAHQLQLYLKACKSIINYKELSEQSSKMLKDAVEKAESDCEQTIKLFALRKALDYIYDEVRLPEVYNEDAGKNAGACASKEAITKEAVLLDFTSGKEVAIKLEHKLLNDTIMGGESQSEFDVGTEGATFKGSVSTARKGGFASVRFHAESVEEMRKVLKGCTGFIVTVKNTHERQCCVKLQLASEAKLRAFNYQSQIILEPNQKDYSLVFLHISTFWPTMFGHVLSAPGKLDTEKVDTIGLIVSKLGDNGKPNPNFVEGEFSLVLKEIKIVY
eukprot:gene5356-6027_t